MKIMKPASMRVEAGFVVDRSKFRWRMKLTTFYAHLYSFMLRGRGIPFESSP